MAQSAEPDNPNLLAFTNIPVPQRRVRRDARAQERRCAGRIKPIRYSQNKCFINHNAVGISAVCNPAKHLVGTVISQDQFVLAILLLAGETTGTLTAGTDHTTHRGEISGFEFLDRASGLYYTADNFMSWNAGINRWHELVPFIAHGVQIRVTHSAVQDIDLNIGGPGIPPVKGKGSQSGLRVLSRKRFRRIRAWLGRLFFCLFDFGHLFLPSFPPAYR